MDYSSDPVLQREMFRPRGKAAKEDGIASIETPEGDMARRKREAAALLEEARVAQDPSNFTTLDMQDRPAVFRPVAAQSAQAPQQNVLQQMQQMQAAGLRPVGMADGGYVLPGRFSFISGVPGAGLDYGFGLNTSSSEDTGEEKVVPESQSTTLESIKADRAKEREENINMALIQAGLAMAAGKSPNALSNIAEGGMSGIKSFTEAEAASRRAQREDERYARQEKLSREEMAQRADLAAKQLAATADLAAAERSSREGMFKTTEDRLNTQMKFEFNKTEAAQDIARQELELKKQVAANQITQAEADRIQKDTQFAKSLEFDKWKVEQGLAAPSDNMKLYSAIGDGDIKKGLEIVQAATVADTNAKAAQNILNPMSGASLDEQAWARKYLLSLIKTAPSGTVDANNPLLKQP